MNTTPQFKVSYDGESEFKCGEHTVKVRSFAHERNSFAAHFPAVMETIGTVMLGYPRYHEFPPEEVCKHFPGYTPARFTETWDVEYQGTPPRLTVQRADMNPPGESDPDPRRMFSTVYEARYLQGFNLWWEGRR